MSETSQFIAPHQVERRRVTSGRPGVDPGQRSPLEVSHQPHTHLSGSASQVRSLCFACCGGYVISLMEWNVDVLRVFACVLVVVIYSRIVFCHQVAVLC